jgi:hypothetical protein
MKADSTIKARVFLSGIMVDAAPNARAVVTFGDCITDGAPAHILTAFDSADHLHPKDDGYKAMADSIDLKMLTARP